MIWISSDTLFGNNCDAVRQELPSMWSVRWLALILAVHTDQEFAVQSLDAVVPDWSMTTYIPWLPALNAYHHGSGYDPDILVADCPWTFRKSHSLAAFDTASPLLWYFRLLPKSACYIYHHDRESDISAPSPTVSLLVIVVPSIHQLDILSLPYVLSAAFSAPSPQRYTIDGTTSHILL